MATPSVVLLDNHTTARKGWKWENTPETKWESYFANYLKYNGYDIRMQPFYLFRSGYIESGRLNQTGGKYGDYWSSTTVSINDAYNLLVYSDKTFPSNNGSRWYGFSIRCLAK